MVASINENDRMKKTIFRTKRQKLKSSITLDSQTPHDDAQMRRETTSEEEMNQKTPKKINMKNKKERRTLNVIPGVLETCIELRGLLSLQ